VNHDQGRELACAGTLPGRYRAALAAINSAGGSEETQYNTLMDAGATFAQQYQSRSCISLSAQQMM
jgi:hypothetical protein